MNNRRSVLIHWPRSLAAGAFIACLSAPALAADACSQWSLQGAVSLTQSNNSDNATRLQLEQAGTQFKGTASYSYVHEDKVLPFGPSRNNHRRATGPIVGTVVGNAFEATVYWSNNSVGVYTGQIGPQGLLVGRTYDKTDPAATADFHSDKPLVCLTRVPSAPGLGAAAAKPPVALGRVQGESPSPSRTSICDAARSARARNSPAAPGLERQCNALAETMKVSPRVLEPTPGSTHVPQTAMRIRVAPAKEAKDTAYELEIQVKANFDWRALTTIPVNAQVAQSALGYKGWGAHLAGTGPQMTAAVGDYRIRARATAPRRSEPGDWVEFKIDGKPGATIDELARSKVDKVGGASTTGTMPMARPVSPLALPAQTPLSAAKNKANAVSLNPQPLPPAAATTQAPSALR